MDAEAARRIIMQLPDGKARLLEMQERAEADRFRFRHKMYLDSVRLAALHDLDRIREQQKRVARIEAAINSIPDETTRKIVTLRSKGASWVKVSMAVYLSENAARDRFDRACEDLAILLAGGA